MDPIALSPEDQINLRGRKQLAASIIQMVGRAYLNNHYLEQDNDHATYVGILKQQITSTLEKDDAQNPAETLIQFLGRYMRRVEEYTRPLDVDGFRDTRKFIESGLDHFDCEKCGANGKFCKGGEADALQFAHDSGGRCLSFLKEITENFITLAEKEYRRIVTDGEVSEILPPILLATEVLEEPCGTLPIDGEFRQPNGSREAMIRVLWPKDDQFGEAILSLPYLVFHEVFVHGAQGAACDGDRFLVDQDCAFTEGAVDAVACDILESRVLHDENVLPELLQPLAHDFWQASKDYHVKRYKLPESGQNAPGDDIRRARSRGRNQIYRLLHALALKTRQPDGWAKKVILTLNLYLSREDRKEFFHLCKLFEHRRARQIALVDPMKQFLELRDVHTLLNRMKISL